jgi:hypothetical protein
MTRISTLGAAIVVAAAIAAPAFAYDTNHHDRAHKNPRNAYNQVSRPVFPATATPDDWNTNIQNFGFSGRDPSRVGGEDPSIRPPS